MAKVVKITLGTELLKTRCRVCGSMFPQKYNGRTREYCNDNCKNYFKYLSALDRVLTDIQFKDLSFIKSVKSDLFSLVNSLPKKINDD